MDSLWACQTVEQTGPFESVLKSGVSVGDIVDAVTSDCAVGIVAATGAATLAVGSVVTGVAAVQSGALVTGTATSVALSGTVIAGASFGGQASYIADFGLTATENLGACW